MFLRVDHPVLWRQTLHTFGFEMSFHCESQASLKFGMPLSELLSIGVVGSAAAAPCLGMESSPNLTHCLPQPPVQFLTSE